MNDLLCRKQWKGALNRTMYRSLALLKIITDLELRARLLSLRRPLS